MMIMPMIMLVVEYCTLGSSNEILFHVVESKHGFYSTFVTVNIVTGFSSKNE